MSTGHEGSYVDLWYSDGGAGDGKQRWTIKDFPGGAATNEIVMIYPDSECWDNHGAVDSENYLGNEGAVPWMFMSMICRLTTADEASDKCADSASLLSATAVITTATLALLLQ